jgi:hypothetical protein
MYMHVWMLSSQIDCSLAAESIMLASRSLDKEVIGMILLCHRAMVESRFRVEECRFNTIFGTFEGHRIYASRKVAEKIEIQTRYAAELYNVDVRQDRRYLAEKDLSEDYQENNLSLCLEHY